MEFDLDRYRTAGSAAADVLKRLIPEITAGRSVAELCRMGDAWMIDELKPVFSKDPKGVCFPTSFGIDSVVGPLAPTQKEDLTIPDNCVVHVELGCQVGGFPARCGKSVVVGAVSEEKHRLVNTAMSVAASVVNSFKENGSTEKTMSRVKEGLDGNFLPVVADPDIRAPGIFSYQMSRDVIDGYNDDDVDEDKVHKVITHRDHEDYEFTSEDTDYDRNDVFCFDLVLCSEDTKLVPTEHRVTILRRDVEKRYALRLKASKACLNLFSDGFARSLANEELKILAGVKECATHSLLIPYGGFRAKKGDVARFQFTVVVGKNRGIVLTEIF